MKVQRDGREFTVEVRADGEGVISHAGTAMLAETADRIGLTGALSRGPRADARAPRRPRPRPSGARSRGDARRRRGLPLRPGRAARTGPLFGAVCSDATAWRAMDAIAATPADSERCGARAGRRASAPGKPTGSPGVRGRRPRRDAGRSRLGEGGRRRDLQGRLRVSPDARLARPTAEVSGEALAGILRPGNAGANTAADQIEVAEHALEQLPERRVEGGLRDRAALRLRRRHPRAARLGARGRHRLLGRLRPDRAGARGDRSRSRIERWVSALTQDGVPRDNGEVAEATDLSTSRAGREGSRLIVRREHPHPGAQLSFTDADGHRFQAILTDRDGRGSPSWSAATAPAPACEDRIRCDKETGLRAAPLPRVRDERGLAGARPDRAADLIDLDRHGCSSAASWPGCEPKRLRYRLLHVAGAARLPRPPSDPAAGAPLALGEELAAAFERLRAAPGASGLSAPSGFAEPRFLPSGRILCRSAVSACAERPSRALPTGSAGAPPRANSRPQHRRSHTCLLRAGVTRWRLVNDLG